MIATHWPVYSNPACNEMKFPNIISLISYNLAQNHILEAENGTCIVQGIETFL
jgi:hypothetical protein